MFYLIVMFCFLFSNFRGSNSNIILGGTNSITKSSWFFVICDMSNEASLNSWYMRISMYNYEDLHAQPVKEVVRSKTNLYNMSKCPLQLLFSNWHALNESSTVHSCHFCYSLLHFNVIHSRIVSASLLSSGTWKSQRKYLQGGKLLISVSRRRPACNLFHYCH